MRKLLALVAAMWLVACSGGQAQGITDTFFEPCTPQLYFDDLAWSPDGKTLLVTVRSVAGWGIGAINTDGTGVLRLLKPLETGSVGGVWSPDGTQIAFGSSQASPDPVDCGVGCLSEIYLMDADGSGQTRLTNVPGTDTYGWPQWSPDGRQLVFSIIRKASIIGIGVINTDGSGFTQLPGEYGSSPRWSPDGSHIAYWSSSNEGGGLSIMNPDGSEIRQLDAVPAMGGEMDPVWLPDGGHIAFPDLQNGLSIASLDGSAPQPMTGGSGEDQHPVWSPDGEYVAFESNRGNQGFNIFVIRRDAKTGYNEVVTDGASSAIQLTHGNDWYYSIAWSPDSKRIAFAGGPGASEVYLMDVNGGNQIRLTTNPSNQQCLTWLF